MASKEKCKIIILPPRRWKELRALRLESLKEEPVAFGASVVEESASPKSKFVDRLKSKQTLCAEVNGVLVGLIGFRPGKRKRTRHVVEVGPFYVCKVRRRNGVGSKLLKAALMLAKKRHAEKVRLEVNKNSRAAIAVYKKFGFKKVGALKKEFKIKGKYYDILVLEKFI